MPLAHPQDKPAVRNARAEEFETLARPLIEWLNRNYNPHASIHITPDSAEVAEGSLGFQTDDYVPD